MAFYHVSSGRAYGPSEPGESLKDYRGSCAGTTRRRDFAADYAYKEIRAQFESQALLDRICTHKALAKLPNDLRTIPIDASGRKILEIPCGSQRSVTINAGR